ncbi:hypothetical protein FZX09_05055 [Synechococcus sp. MU1643]|uniref:hypothetical protein n=1 Tax=Synechococcus sp. MU1643 TaxID=2508349 RepID=UPI001CF8C531|nr:hypothetical protein [Synechococcus sp. MU1643]MCB4428174.1 hypothetical protein [Synechococcus sp. MU1643]
MTDGIHIGCDKYFQLMWHAAQIILAYEAFRVDLAEDSKKLLDAVRFLAYGPYFTQINQFPHIFKLILDELNFINV